MKIHELFKELEVATQNRENIFGGSGMVNWYNKMRYGFFPLGLGILTENNKQATATPTTEIEEGGIMVLGNDFGTVPYVDSYIGNPNKEIGETESKTINNLLNKNVGLDVNKTFFTNFYLGVRTHKDATMTKRVEILQNDYKKLCYKFFITQLNFFKPAVVICLGHDVRKVLSDAAEHGFAKWKPKSISINKLHNDENYIISNSVFGNMKFVIIPHPCDLRNFKEAHMIKLNQILNDKNES